MKKGIVCLDFDSTICKYETLDKLIKDLKLNNKKDVNIESITKSAMNGSVDFFDSLNYRMSFVTGITKEKLQEYTDDFIRRDDLYPKINLFLEKCYNLDYDVCIISGGFRNIISEYILKGYLNIDENYVFANQFKFNQEQEIIGFLESDLNYSDGKVKVVNKLKKKYNRVITVGDGSTDLATKDYVDYFIAFTKYALRKNIVKKSDFETNSFEWIGNFIENLDDINKEIKKLINTNNN